MILEINDKELSILRMALFIDVESDPQPDPEKVQLLERLNQLIEGIN